MSQEWRLQASPWKTLFTIIAGQVQIVVAASTRHICRRCMCCQLLPNEMLYTLQAMEYMVNCKYVEATEKCGHPVDSHCVILVSPLPRRQLLHCLHHCCCADVSASLTAQVSSASSVLNVGQRISEIQRHACPQDLAGLRMNMLNQNTIKVFKSMSGIYQDHYPVSPQHPLLQSIMQLSGCCCYRLQLCSEKPAIAISLLLLLLHCTNQHCSWSKCLLLQELMSRMFLVNIPLMFAAVWRVLQMFVDDRVKAKIRFLRKADFHILHEFVDRDSLPESLGGKAKEKLLSDKQGQLACMLLTPFGIGSTASPLSPVDQLHWHCFLLACLLA